MWECPNPPEKQGQLPWASPLIRQLVSRPGKAVFSVAKAGHCPVLAVRGLWGLRGSTDGATVSLLQLLRGGRQGGGGVRRAIHSSWC